MKKDKQEVSTAETQEATPEPNGWNDGRIYLSDVQLLSVQSHPTANGPTLSKNSTGVEFMYFKDGVVYVKCREGKNHGPFNGKLVLIPFSQCAKVIAQ